MSNKSLEKSMRMLKIPLLDLNAQYQSIQSEIDVAIKEVLLSGHFILGEKVAALEKEVTDYLGVDFGIGVASGTDALILALRALGIGPNDEVIIPAYTFFATVGAVLHVGAKPVLVDIEPRTYCMDVEKMQAAITPFAKAVIPVHLYGHPADMNPIKAIAREHELKIVEDNAQAFGSEYMGRKTGSFGDAGCLSFFPSKNLGGYGDGGMVVTSDPILAENIAMLRTHGWKKKYFPEILGYNSRLDALQAAILRVKLHYLDAWNDRRRLLAEIYNCELDNCAGLVTPYEDPESKHVYHLYIIQSPDRDAIQGVLRKNEISSGIYYPQPMHLTKIGRELNYRKGDFPVSEQASRETLALPIYPELSEVQQSRVTNVIQGFLDR